MPEEHRALLQADIKAFGEAFWHNEQIGETRVNFFLTLATAAVAAMVGLLTAKLPEVPLTPEWVEFAAVTITVVLLLFGFATLLRLVKRDIATEEYKHAGDVARVFLKGNGLAGYAPYCLPRSHRVTLGGLADLVALVDGVLAALLAYKWIADLAPDTLPLPRSIIAALIGTMTFAALSIYAHQKRRGAEDFLKNALRNAERSVGDSATKDPHPESHTP